MKKLFGFLTLFSLILFVGACEDDTTGPTHHPTPNTKVDTVIVTRVDTVKVPVVRVDTVKVNILRVDTLVKTITTVDTVVVTKVVVKTDTLYVPKIVTKYDTIIVHKHRVDTLVVRVTDTVFVPTPIICDYSLPPGQMPKSCPDRNNGKNP